MKKRERPTCALIVDRERLLEALRSPDAAARARAVHSLCPCTADWTIFEGWMDVIARLRKDPDPEVRAAALHVFEDAAQMESGGVPTHRREATNEMLWTRRRSRFRREDDDPDHHADRRPDAHSGRRVHAPGNTSIRDAVA